ncbi:MAG: hypothetical protein K2F81_06255 [Ruminococcus sp.]|nr:hypothetical protein [Ruminococcus sp.]
MRDVLVKNKAFGFPKAFVVYIKIKACPFSTWQGQLQLTFLVGDCTPTKNIMAPAATPIRKDRLEAGVHLA